MAFSIRVETPGDFTQLQKQLSKDQAMLMVRCYDAVAAELGWTIVAGIGTDGGKSSTSWPICISLFAKL